MCGELQARARVQVLVLVQELRRELQERGEAEVEEALSGSEYIEEATK